MKLLTPDEAEAKRQKAVAFLRRIGNDELADQFENMSATEYAEHKGAELLNENPRRRNTPMKSKQELERELDEANSYIEELESKLDDIVGIAGDEEDGDDEELDEDEDESPE
jgi:hypothetical protein